ncbi:sugar phosphate nucleotidyltransferase [Methanoplanus endosymbiosus]|uniref:sugar phosphate nucleotidyltransferase n=1 Tax=Methanoplanus endosymbiosus TaxID=33865 RepID=UPI0027E244DB|nr:sugar phosphate nucleotidyltransferase [Methanoplanus endosymbiosus]
MSEVKKAVIPVAGLGTRFLPATKAMPKEMLPLIDRPIIHYVVEEAINSGIEDLILITGRSKRPIEDYFDDSPELKMHHQILVQPNITHLHKTFITTSKEQIWWKEKQLTDKTHLLNYLKEVNKNKR